MDQKRCKSSSRSVSTYLLGAGVGLASLVFAAKISDTYAIAKDRLKPHGCLAMLARELA
jgi:hypothetical protein